MARAGVLERGEALICLEGLRELDDAGHVLAAVGETGAPAQTVVKAHRDASSKQGRRWLLMSPFDHDLRADLLPSAPLRRNWLTQAGALARGAPTA